MTISAPSSPTTPTSPGARVLAPPLRVAVVGLGERGLAHAGVLATLPRATLVGFVDSSGAARKNALGAGFAAPSFGKLDRLLAKQQPDAVFVCAPLISRPILARRAIAAGCAVFIERPIALAYGESARVVDEARKAGTPLLSSHALAHQPVFTRAAETVRGGLIGKVHEVRASVYVSRVFNAQAADRLIGLLGGGMLAYAAFDLFSYLVSLFGLPTEASAQANRLYGSREDEYHAKLTLPGGGTIGIDCSWSVPGYPRPATVIEMQGDRGHLLVSDDALEIDDTAGNHQRWSDADLPQPARFDLDGEPRWIEDSAFVERVLSGAGMDSESEVLATHALMRDLLASAHDGGREVQVNGGAAR